MSRRASTAPGEASTKVAGREKAGGAQRVCHDRVSITQYGTRRRERHEQRAEGDVDKMRCKGGEANARHWAGAGAEASTTKDVASRGQGRDDLDC